MDTSIANVSLPHIAGNLAASLDESTWVLTSYLVSNAIVLPISGWLSTVVGRKRFYMICVATFGVSSLLCSIAPSLGWLIAFRILQGLGGGGLAPSEQSILADSFPTRQRGQAFALYGITVVVAPTLGPTLGGWITDNYSWRWIFLINVPFCAASLALSHWVLHDPPAVRRDREDLLRGGLRVDGLGFGLVALGLGSLQVLLDRGEQDDWFASDFIVALAIISAMSLAALVVWELRHERPIVDLPLLKNRTFAASTVVMFATGFILLSTTQLLPLFLQTLLGYTATEAGMALTAGGFATLFLMPVAGAALRAIQPRVLIAVALLVEALALFHLSGFTTDIDFRHAAWARVFQASGLPFLFVPITTASYSGIPEGKSGNASALINVMRNLGGSVGISFGVSVLDRRGQFHHSRLAETVTPFSPAAGQHLSLPALDARVLEQATLWSYIDVLRLLAWVALALIPVALLLRKVDLGKAAAH
jgi:DHA2 family multidrug resistance protein